MIFEHEPGRHPKLVDSGQHTSSFEWDYKNGTRLRVEYNVNWRMHHQETLDNWIVTFDMTTSGSPGAEPRVPPGQFDITTKDATSLKTAQTTADRRRIFEDLMNRYRKQAFSLLDDRHMCEPNFPKIDLIQEETTE